MKIVAVIPARYNSSRLPGKPLVDLCGKSLIRRVYENVNQCNYIDTIIVATDDNRIYQEVIGFDGKCQLTDPNLPSGTDRVATVVENIDCDIVVNVQGDEPFLDPEVIDKAIQALIDNPGYMVSSIGKVGMSQAEIGSPNTVKVIINKQNEAIYFSRYGIPYIRDIQNSKISSPALKHIGLYVFRKHYLLEFTKTESSVLEQLEKLEQLRIIENCEKIYIAKTYKNCFGIDTPEDLIKARKWLQDE